MGGIYGALMVSLYADTTGRWGFLHRLDYEWVEQFFLEILMRSALMLLIGIPIPLIILYNIFF